VVTALEMPRLDGFQLIARIRREATLRGLPIVVLSSRTSQGARDRALAAGANVFLPKSRHRRSLVAAVTSCLLPFPLRFPLAFDGKLLGQVVRIFTDTIAGWRRARAKRAWGRGWAGRP
jgi:response regulator RpfG family c-di-GMP phosphodiesterase